MRGWPEIVLSRGRTVVADGQLHVARGSGQYLRRLPHDRRLGDRRPTGEIAAQSQGEGDELLFVNADLALGDNFRRFVFHFVAHRRPKHGLIVERIGAGEPLA